VKLESGQQLLHYRLRDRIGEGAMGVVWHADDTTLGREVAIKVLPEDLARDPDRLARFDREARLLATIQHPNVASVYGRHEVDGVHFIAMEFVPGESLAERLARSPAGRLAIEDVVDVGRQVAEALETAHEAGVVHRDLKPANVVVRPDGTVKVLDFGLARELRGGLRSGSDPDAPTVTFTETADGAIVGTLVYMSPEQARGMTVDRRTDVWALGCLLYECLVGHRAFDGETPADVLAAILSKPPALDGLPGTTPAGLRRLVERCLVKDPRQRLRDVGEARIALEVLARGGPAPSDLPTPAHSSPALRRPWVAWTVATMALAVAAIAVFRRGGSETASAGHETSAWTIPLPEDMRIRMPGPGGKFDYSRLLAISSDGRKIVFAAAPEPEGEVRLYLRDRQSTEVGPIAGTEGGRGPFFSPDGRWLAFFSGTRLLKVSLSGGSPQELADLGRMISFDGAWSPDGRTIVYATDLGLWTIPADGGTPSRLSEPDPAKGESGHHSPRFTDDGTAILFTVTRTPERLLARLDLEAGTWETVLRDAAQGLPLSGDRLLFARGGELLVTSWDGRKKAVTGSPISVLSDILVAPGLGGMLVTQFDVARDGSLIYVPAPQEKEDDQLLWVARDGREQEILRGPGTWVHPRLSPDGRRVSIDIHGGASPGMRDIYIVELEKRQLNRLTTTGYSWESEWRPDGRRLSLLSGAPFGHWSLFWVATDFSGGPQLLYPAEHAIPLGWLPDGRSFLFSRQRFDGGLWRFWVDGSREPEPVLATSARERFGTLSSDGRWLAYVADESGRDEVFLRSFPDLGQRTRVTVDGGGEPLFAHSGKELFFRHRGALYRVPVSLGSRLEVGAPELLFEGDYDDAPVGHQHYDVGLDDRRFLMIRHGESGGRDEVRVLLGWADGLDAAI